MTEQITAQQELAELAEAYREADEQEKQAKAVKDQLKGPMFELMSEVVMDEVPLARKTIRISVDDMTDLYEDEFESWRAHNYPTWVIVSIQTDADGYNIEIEESPFFMKYEFVVDGYKFGRTITTPTPTFDAERFVKENPDLKKLVNEETKIIYSLDERKASKYMAENPSSKNIFEKYVDTGQPSVKMIPIKQVIEE